MSRIRDALKKADKERGRLLTRNPDLGFMVGMPERKNHAIARNVLGAIVVLVFIGAGWRLLNHDSETENHVIVSRKVPPISSVRANFIVEDRAFAKKLNVSYQKQIESVEETAQERTQVEVKPSRAETSPTTGADEAARQESTEIEIVKKSPQSPIKNDAAQTVLTTYVVRPGDNLSRIAGYDFIYGDRNLWKKIYEANKDKLKSPDKVVVGQKLIIPTLDRIATEPETKDATMN